jgi:hypothetical protein
MLSPPPATKPVYKSKAEAYLQGFKGPQREADMVTMILRQPPAAKISKRRSGLATIQ